MLGLGASCLADGRTETSGPEDRPEEELPPLGGIFSDYPCMILTGSRFPGQSSPASPDVRTCTLDTEKNGAPLTTGIQRGTNLIQ